MNMPTIQPLSYSGYRFLAVIISHCTWLYFRFALSYRDASEKDQIECANSTQNVGVCCLLVFSPPIVLIIKGAKEPLRLAAGPRQLGRRWLPGCHGGAAR